MSIEKRYIYLIVRKAALYAQEMKYILLLGNFATLVYLATYFPQTKQQ